MPRYTPLNWSILNQDEHKLKPSTERWNYLPRSPDFIFFFFFPERQEEKLISDTTLCPDQQDLQHSVLDWLRSYVLMWNLSSFLKNVCRSISWLTQATVYHRKKCTCINQNRVSSVLWLCSVPKREHHHGWNKCPIVFIMKLINFRIKN